MAKYSSLLSLTVCLLVLLHGCAAQIEQQRWLGSQHRQDRDQSECNVQNLRALEPTSQVRSEAGVTEYWDENNEQLDCAGVAASRRTIEPRGLLLPSYSSSPEMIHILQGSGLTGVVIPGCPETFQSSQRSHGQSQESRGFMDQHQKIRRFRAGDILAIPAGVVHWCYNDGDKPVIAVTVHDTSNDVNQLDRNLRKFQLAGGQQTEGQGQQSSSNNILSGFAERILMEVFGVNRETATKLQSKNDNRGEIVRVEEGLQVRTPEQEEQEQQQERQLRTNGLEETLCTLRLRENIANPDRADVYNPQGGRISSLNSQKLPVLYNLQLSAERVVLYRNAILAPHWNLNAHSVIYAIRGRSYVQIVGNYDKPVFDGELREGQLLVVPQSFAVVIKARDEGFEYVAIKTNDNAMISPLAGRTSALRGIPVEVLMNAYQINRDEAQSLKFNRQELTILSPSSRSEGRASA